MSNASPPSRHPPSLEELGHDLLATTLIQRGWSLALPFLAAGLYFFRLAACA